MIDTTPVAVDERLVVYSLALLGDPSCHHDLTWRFARSVSTLRLHNREIPVVLFVHGAVSDELVRICAVHHVVLRERGSYAARLAAMCPTGWTALVQHPLLHRFLAVADLATQHARQILICDCDTIFLRDVADLFGRYSDADVTARPLADDRFLARLAAREGIASVAPFDVGVVLLNNGAWGQLGALGDRYVDYAWRFVVGMLVEQGDLPTRVERLGLAEARLHATDDDVMRALPYPSADRWAVDEVAWWMTLGHVPGLRIADFDAADVADAVE